MEEKDVTPTEIFDTLAIRFREAKALEHKIDSNLHFTLTDQTKGDYLYTVKVQNGKLEVQTGHHDKPTCTVRTKAQTYVDVNLGKTKPQMAIMLGKIKVSNLPEMFLFAQLFEKFTLDYVK
ncbi:alkyl sulfatase C-terminal domain-containing protein [uncultured Microscilla sp.]|uniref:SCP2 sterol-binding domain-containing protein n=1 Tax=uncultured Microscilla sp. TaxID=432653 RepID=UPI00260D8830|nr:alkyl sulfatase C-terminal domain-containing protein [uncultured Microscilla sp.]